ncbi:MAG TPA: hypothetical protein DCM87_16145 [Planctomycetes bacterium]|nr:hypothetical protein [Planctomycetota bacterium]
MSSFERYRAFDYEFPGTTLAWQLSGRGFESLRLAELPRPKPGPEDVAFRVDSNSLCFSDTKVVAAGPEHPRLAGYDMAKDKVVLGHEISIALIEVGPKALPSMRLHGRYIVQADLYKYNTAVGYAVWGGMLQYGVFDRRVQEYLIPVEGDIGYSTASLVEPWACIEASYARCEILPADETFWVMGGGGPMGQMHVLRALAMKRAGALPALRHLIISEPSRERLDAVGRRLEDIARDAGVALVLLDPTSPAFDNEMRAVAPNGVDYCVACAPVPQVVVDCRRYVGRYGVLNVFAGLKRGTGPVNLGDIHYDQHTVTGNTGSRLLDMQRVLAKAERGELDTDASAAAVVGMREADKGLRAVAEGTITNKIVLYPQLPDLPLTLLADLPSRARFDGGTAAELKAGRWSRTAEAELFDAFLRL